MKRLAFACLLVTLSHAVHAADFPIRPVRFLVANPPSGTTDLIARLLAKRLGEMWGQSVIVDNRAGGGGTIGTDIAAKAEGNGYTILISAPAPITTNITLFGGLPYDPQKDLRPITLIAITPSLLLVGPSIPSKTVSELIALAKSRPGKLNYASAGIGNPSHLQGVMFSNLAGVDMVHVPYKGTGPAIVDLLGGTVDIMFNTIPAMLPLVKANRVRALAITSSKRFSGLPDVPTTTEVGMPSLQSSGWYGALAPGKTPDALIKKLHADFTAAIDTPEVRDVLVSQGAFVIAGTPAHFAEFIRDETERVRKVIKASGARRDR